MSNRHPRHPGPSDNVDQLRHDIDSGRTGDKVSAPDPAIAPLGTDDEAAGTPARPHEVATARRIERGRSNHSAEHERRFPVWWMIIALVVIVTILVLLPFIP
jgi:hypothetical protein